MATILTKTKIRKAKTSIWVVFTILVFLRKIRAANHHVITMYTAAGSNSGSILLCRTGITANIANYWLKPGTKIGFTKIKSLPIDSDKFILNDSNEPQYSVLKRDETSGSICLMPNPSFQGWIFVNIVFIRHPTLTDKCVADFFITSSHLVACDGSETDIETMLSLKNSNYNEVAKHDLMIFDKNLIANGHEVYFGIQFTTPFSVSDIDTEFVEFLTMHGYYSTFYSICGTFFIPIMENIRQAYHIKKGQIMSPKTFVERNTWNSLRGYFLIPDPSDPFGEYCRTTGSYASQRISVTIHAQFYISEPHLMTENDIYMVYINTRPFIPYETNNDYTIKKLDYKLKIQRLVSTSKMKFTLYREISNSPQEATSLEINYPGGDQNWMHFVVSIGVGPLYIIDSANVKLKRIESIFSWYNTNRNYAKATDFTETQPITSMYPVKTKNEREIIMTVGLEAFSDAGMTNRILTNDFGLRLFELNLKKGAIPPDFVATSAGLKDNRCIIHGFLNSYCMIHVFLRNENDSNNYGLDRNQYKTRKSNCPTSQCRYCKSGGICMFAKPGVNEDLFFDTNFRFSVERYPHTLYDPANPVNANEFVRVTNNVGKEYWIRCPMHCK